MSMKHHQAGSISIQKAFLPHTHTQSMLQTKGAWVAITKLLLPTPWRFMTQMYITTLSGNPNKRAQVHWVCSTFCFHQVLSAQSDFLKVQMRYDFERPQVHTWLPPWRKGELRAQKEIEPKRSWHPWKGPSWGGRRRPGTCPAARLPLPCSLCSTAPPPPHSAVSLLETIEAATFRRKQICLIGCHLKAKQSKTALW